MSTLDFHCYVCGVETDLAPDPPEKAVCPAHCKDHNYISVFGMPSKCCEYCGQPIPDDWR